MKIEAFLSSSFSEIDEEIIMKFIDSGSLKNLVPSIQEIKEVVKKKKKKFGLFKSNFVNNLINFFLSM